MYFYIALKMNRTSIKILTVFRSTVELQRLEDIGELVYQQAVPSTSLPPQDILRRREEEGKRIMLPLYLKD
jgi:hypothetical protein